MRRFFGNLHLLIGVYLEGHPIGRVFLSPFDVVFSNFDVVEPDLLYLSHERAALALTPKHLKGTPELVVEIDVVRVYRRQGRRFARAVELSREAAETLTTPPLPGLSLPLARIFRE